MVEIGADVSGNFVGLGKLDDALTPEVEFAEYEGDASFFGDEIKTGFEVGHLAAGTFGGDAELEIFLGFEDLRNGLDEIGPFGPHHRHAAHPGQEPTERRLKQRRLAHKIDVLAYGRPHVKAVREVSVRSVRDRWQNVLLRPFPVVGVNDTDAVEAKHETA